MENANSGSWKALEEFKDINVSGTPRYMVQVYRGGKDNYYEREPHLTLIT